MQRSWNGSVWRKTSTSLSLTPDNMDSDQHLPTYDPLSHVAQWDFSRLRSAQNAVHLIPLLVLLCAIILCSPQQPLFINQGEQIIQNKISPISLSFFSFNASKYLILPISDFEFYGWTISDYGQRLIHETQRSAYIFVLCWLFPRNPWKEATVKKTYHKIFFLLCIMCLHWNLDRKFIELCSTIDCCMFIHSKTLFNFDAITRLCWFIRRKAHVLSGEIMAI